MAAFWFRSGLSRPVSALSVLLLTTLTVASAATGPLISRAIAQSALAQAIQTAPAATTDITVDAQFSPDETASDVIDSVHSTAEIAGSSGLFRPPVDTASTDPISWRTAGKQTGAAPGPKIIGRVVATSDDCARISLDAGRCPSGGTDIAVVTKAGTAAPAIGSSITVAYDTAPTVFTVIGIADSARSTAILPSDVTALAADDLVVSPGGIEHTGLSGRVTSRASLIPAALHVDQLNQARQTCAQVQAAGLQQDLSLSVQTGLTGVLDQAARDRRAADVLLLLVTVQALTAAWLGAFVVFAVVAQERQREWALGRLRGLRRRRWLGMVFGEPVLLLIAGSVIGLGVALVAGRLAVSHWLRPGTPLEPWRIPVWSAALLAVLGSVAALGVASLRAVRAPLATLLREAGEPTRITRLAAISETVVLVAAVAAVIQLRSSSNLVDSTALLGLLTPALLAATLGLLSIRGLVALGRRLARRPARSLFSVVVLRRLTRTPTQLRSAVVIAIGVSVIVFSSQLSALSARNRLLLAQATTGSASVLSLRVPAGVDLVNAVRRADPSGRNAMAVEVRNAFLDAGTSRVVAVDTQRLAAVAAWRPVGTSLSLAQIAQRLHPAAAPAITVKGRQISLRLTNSRVLRQRTSGRKVPIPQLEVTLSDGHSWQTVPLGTIRAGNLTLTGSMNCPTGCRLVRVGTVNAEDTDHSAYLASFTIDDLSTDVQDAATFYTVLRQKTQWRTDPPPDSNGNTVSATVTTGATGLALQFTDLDGSSAPSMAPADVPNPLPALIASGTNVLVLPGQSGALEGTGLSGEPQLLDIAGPQLVLPRLLDDGVLVDLSDATLLSDPSADEASPQVWLTAGNHDDVISALARAHITVLSRGYLADTENSLAQAASARAALTSILVSLLVVLLAAAVLLGGQLLARERRRELLEVLGLARIGRARSARLITLECALPALAGAAIGVVAGLVAVLLAGTRLPLFASQTVHQPLQVVPAWGALAVLVAVAVVAVLVLSGVTAGIEIWQHERRQR